MDNPVHRPMTPLVAAAVVCAVINALLGIFCLIALCREFLEGRFSSAAVIAIYGATFGLTLWSVVQREVKLWKEAFGFTVVLLLFTFTAALGSAFGINFALGAIVYSLAAIPLVFNTWFLMASQPAPPAD